MMNGFNFKIIATSKKSFARVGEISTPHGSFLTPNFISVGTNGSVKALDSLDIANIGLPIIFSNTYHLMLNPGTEVIKQAGGIHKFSGINCPVITDSGGFQVFSLQYGGVFQELKSSGVKTQKNSVLKVSEDGVVFRSYRDGSKVFLSPETSILAQKDIAADIIVAFDELLPYHIDKKYQMKSLERTHRWEHRSLIEHKKNPAGQALYAVVHGGVDFEMRKKSINFLAQHDFDGFAIGGSLGKDSTEMVKMLSELMPLVPKEKSNHLLGIADLPSIRPCVELGLDTFDSSYPTKAARHGLVFTDDGGIYLSRQKNAFNFGPIDKNCLCFTCQNYSVSYLSHLLRSHELAYYRLASIHNLFFMVKYFEKIRGLILAGDL